MRNIAVVIEDIENTNRAFARQESPFFVCCYSHRYNLALKDGLANQHDVILRVRHLMQTISFQIPAALLRKETHLRAKIEVETR